MNRSSNTFPLAFPVTLLVAFATLGNAQTKPSLIDAVQKGHGVGREKEGIEAVRKELAEGADANERDETGWTPLMYAALECRPGIVNLLLENGADAKLRSSTERKTSFMDRGNSALTVGASCFMASRRATIAPSRGMSNDYVLSELAAPRQIVKLLIQSGADVNGADEDGRTPLMMAAMQGWEGAAAVLLAAKAKVDARDAEGRVALDYADLQDRAMLRLLRNANSPQPTGKSGRTVCDAERALDKLGYDTPIIDCILGQQLGGVISRFQKEHQLSPTGELDAPTRKALSIR